jgi:Activator of Hsp90 ATPase homolog 1-like protein
MKADTSEGQSITTLEIGKETEILAPIDVAFESLLAVLGPEGEMPGGKPYPMKIEAWPGGRWYRDLGNNSGHLWGHVQVIKPPTLLEIWGPLMMSYAAVNHLQYRLKAEGGVTRMTLLHRAMGPILSEHRDGVSEGWGYWMEHIRKVAERKSR